MTVIDIFDALTSKRCYRDPMPLTEACRIMMAMRGTTLDPELTDFFFVMLADPDIPRGLLPVEIPTEGEWPMIA
jgi:HD-GYP domain-containing protein (c-di-GMP phosphodiesterase class II)